MATVNYGKQILITDAGFSWPRRLGFLWDPQLLMSALFVEGPRSCLFPFGARCLFVNVTLALHLHLFLTPTDHAVQGERAVWLSEDKKGPGFKLSDLVDIPHFNRHHLMLCKSLRVCVYLMQNWEYMCYVSFVGVVWNFNHVGSHIGLLER